MAGNQNLVAQIIINAKDNASSTFDTVKDKLLTLAKTVGTIELFKSVVDDAAQFELQLDKVAAKGNYTAEEMEILKKSAVEIGASFGLSGTQSAEGLEILAAAGLSSSDAVKALPNVLALAKTEAMGMEDAASLVASAVSQMGLKFSDSQRIVDAYTKGANLSIVSSKDIGESMKYAGGAAHAANLSIEKTVAILDVFADSGIRGESAGTKLQNILAQLGDSSSEARKELSKLGINTSDLGTVLDELKKRGDGAKNVINAFGLVAGPGIRALLAKGTEGISEYEKQIQSATGFGAEAAKKMGDNFEGAKDRLTAAVTNLKTEFGTPFLKPLTDSFDVFSSAITNNTPQIISILVSLSELYGIKLAKDAATFAQGMLTANAAKKAAAAATQQVVAAEQELVAAMAAGGTQTSRYQAAQQQLTTAMSEGGTATQQYAIKQNQLLAAHQSAQAAINRVNVAQAELNAALAAGGVETQRYAQAQIAVNAAQANSQAATQRLATAQADLNAEIAAGGAGSQRAALLEQELNTAKLAAQTATQRLSAAQTELNLANSVGATETQKYATAQRLVEVAQTNAQVAAQKLSVAQSNLNAEITLNGVNSERAIVLQQALNTAQNNASITNQKLSAAQSNLNAIMAEGGANTQRYALALTELQAAETNASAAASKLEAKTAALASSTNVVTASATRMETAFNGAMSVFAGWSIGTMVGEWANQFAFIQRRGADMSQTFVQLVESGRYFFSGDFIKSDSGTYAEKMAEIHNSFEEIRQKTTEAGQAATTSIEQQKKAVQEQAKVVEEFSKLQLDKLKETNAAIDEHYKLENDAIALNLKLKTESIKSTYDDKLAKEKAITEATITASNQEIANLEEAATKKKTLINSVYQEAIDKSASGSSQRAEYEKQYLEASKNVYQSLYDSYAQTVNSMISAAQSHRDKAIGYAEEILNAEERRHSGILELERIGMTDAELKASKKKEIEKGISDYKKAMAEGDFEEAKKISTNTEKLVLDLAKSEKTQTSEVSSAKSKYNEVIGQTEEATKALQASENQQATDLETNAKNQIAKMNDIKGKLSEISETLNKNFLLTINVNKDAVRQASSDIDALSRDEYVTVHVTTVQENSNGGEIQHFETGGQPKFVRREGGLGGYGGGDTVPAMLEPGEWIIKKEAVNKYGNGFMAQLNSMQIQDVPHFSTGGPVSSAIPNDASNIDGWDNLIQILNAGYTGNSEYWRWLNVDDWAKKTNQTDLVKPLQDWWKSDILRGMFNEQFKEVANVAYQNKHKNDPAPTPNTVNTKTVTSSQADQILLTTPAPTPVKTVAPVQTPTSPVITPVNTTVPTPTSPVITPVPTPAPIKTVTPAQTATSPVVAPVITNVPVTTQTNTQTFSDQKAAQDKLIADQKAAADKAQSQIDSLNDQLDGMNGNKIAIENRRYEKQKAELADNLQALALAQKIHAKNIATINAENQKNSTNSSSSQNTPIGANQTSPISNSSNVITIKFQSPNGREVQGSFQHADVTTMIDILKEAASRGLPPTLN